MARTTNRLAAESSLYLRQHAHNPVDWYPWGPEALARARELDRPIFLSIGYSACHWCHVMERESFEDEATADVLNRHFVCIKVDREERPDLDTIYMTALQALTQEGGGWPLSVWLTPDLHPFYAGTYFPPANRYGRPGFRTLPPPHRGGGGHPPRGDHPPVGRGRRVPQRAARRGRGRGVEPGPIDQCGKGAPAGVRPAVRGVRP